MKFLIVFAVVIAAVYADEWHVQTHDDLIKYRNTCATELELTAELIEEYKKWTFPDDDKTKCYIKCIFNKMGLFDDTNGPNVDHITEQLGTDRNTEDTRNLVVQCADKNTAGDDACTWAYRGFTCFKANHADLIKASVKTT